MGVNSKYPKEIIDVRSFLVKLRCDGPVVSMILDIISSHFLQQRFRKIHEEMGFLRIFDGPTKRAALVVDAHISQRVKSVLIHDVMNHFESLTETKHRPRDVVFIFLIYAVLEDLFCSYVIGMQCSIL